MSKNPNAAGVLFVGLGCEINDLAFIGDIAPARREAQTIGIFDISYFSAQAVGPMIGVVVKDVAGFPGVFLSLAVLCLLKSCVSALVSRSRKRTTGGV